MKNKTVITWTISAVLFLVLVTGVYYLVNAWGGGTASHDQHAGHQTEPDQATEHQGHQTDSGHDTASAESDVIPQVSYENNLLKVILQDKTGNRVTDLEMTHEKYLHFILVSDDLQNYYHLHPNPVNNGEFTLKTTLPAGSYKSFIDMKPKNLSYHVEPIPLQIGKEQQANKPSLVPDTSFTKTMEGKTVTLQPATFPKNKEIVLHFRFKEGIPEPYLGALGHVVILDEKAEQYVHVHPVSDTETKFATQFSESGMYKMWAEFQFDGKVITYPFVIKVE